MIPMNISSCPNFCFLNIILLDIYTIEVAGIWYSTHRVLLKYLTRYFSSVPVVPLQIKSLHAADGWTKYYKHVSGDTTSTVTRNVTFPTKGGKTRYCRLRVYNCL
jgi:hypothetical protein